ncbi:uncharacterized protein MONOS_11668 [Monocercomonoides exilis]|uniref:uncharacterized protein n=1 Tax=Monocercomonoides exilis TaxID=2049356 RepID=UPI00355AAFA3|nr:hypothetical protein MONOS_11668 [Monocercomonoides exilis]
MTIAKQFTKLLSELDDCDEDGQKQKIEEMDIIMKVMDKKEFESVISEELFNKIGKMIENKIMTMESAILLMKHIGHWNDLKGNFVQTFDYSSLNKRVQEMIVEEDKKKEEKDEKLLVDLCECYLLFNSFASSEMISICMPCLLKVALKKEENMETQKDVEMALLAFGTIWYCKTEEDQYLDEIKEIIQYHKEHRNLTQLSYQSAWELLINQMYFDSSFGGCCE